MYYLSKETGGQRSPVNPEGKKQYDRKFLLNLQWHPMCLKKPSNLPSLDVIKDKIYPGEGNDRRRTGLQNKAPRKVININISDNQHIKLHRAQNAWAPPRTTLKDSDQARTENLYKKVRGVLNKLTPEKFSTLVSQIKQLEITTEDNLNGVIDLVFEKAIDEPNFSALYANMCKHLAPINVPGGVEGTFVNFRKRLLRKCQTEFQKDRTDEQNRDERIRVIKGCETDEKTRHLQQDSKKEVQKNRRRQLGNIRFIGEIFKLGMLKESVIHQCIKKLLNQRDEDSLECLCRLLTTVGDILENEIKTNAAEMENYFADMETIVAKKQTSSRIRFTLQDVIDLRVNKWVPRRDANNPKTIGQIHKEAETEALEEQQMLRHMTFPRRMPDDQLPAPTEQRLSSASRERDTAIKADNTSSKRGPQDQLPSEIRSQEERNVNAQDTEYSVEDTEKEAKPLTAPRHESSMESTDQLPPPTAKKHPCFSRGRGRRITADNTSTKRGPQDQWPSEIGSQEERNVNAQDTEYSVEDTEKEAKPLTAPRHESSMESTDQLPPPTAKKHPCFSRGRGRRITAVKAFSSPRPQDQWPSEIRSQEERNVNAQDTEYSVEDTEKEAKPLTAPSHESSMESTDQLPPPTAKKHPCFSRGRGRRITTLKDSDQVRTENLYKKVRGVLNKLTPEKFSTLVSQIKQLEITTEDNLNGVIDLVFEKAIDEPNFSALYANMCKHLALINVPGGEEGTFVNFRKRLLRKCQIEFQKDRTDEQNRDERIRVIKGCETDEKTRHLQQDSKKEVQKNRRRQLGNIRFIGEIFKLGMLKESVIHQCIKKLLNQRDEDSLECLCRLLSTVGDVLENEIKTSAAEMENYFTDMKTIVAKKQTSSRIRFTLQDVIDLRVNKWVPRRDANNPKTIGQIHKEAEIEALEEQQMLRQMTFPRRMPDDQLLAPTEQRLSSASRERDTAIKADNTSTKRGPQDQWPSEIRSQEERNVNAQDIEYSVEDTEKKAKPLTAPSHESSMESTDQLPPPTAKRHLCFSRGRGRRITEDAVEKLQRMLRQMTFPRRIPDDQLLAPTEQRLSSASRKRDTAIKDDNTSTKRGPQDQCPSEIRSQEERNVNAQDTEYSVEDTEKKAKPLSAPSHESSMESTDQLPPPTAKKHPCFSRGRGRRITAVTSEIRSQEAQNVSSLSC